jgi:septum site-determining protein MinD
LIVNPELSSIVDALKTKILTEVIGGHVFGVVINRAGIDRSEVMTQKMERVLGVRVLGTIPEDPNIRRAASYKTPVVVKFPSSPAAVAFRNLAGEIAGIPMEQRGGTTQEKFIDRFSRVLFRGKK